MLTQNKIYKGKTEISRMAAESGKNNSQYSQFSAFGSSNRYAGIHALGGPPTPLMMSSLMSKSAYHHDLPERVLPSEIPEDSKKVDEPTNYDESAISNGITAFEHHIIGIFLCLRLKSHCHL